MRREILVYPIRSLRGRRSPWPRWTTGSAPSSATCSRRCTPPRGSGSPRPRWGWGSGSSSSTSPPWTRRSPPWPSSTPRSSRGKDRSTGVEGCLSVPGVQGEVCRAETVEVRGMDEQGNPLRIQAAGILSRALQHEIDHLDGILFIDRRFLLRGGLREVISPVARSRRRPVAHGVHGDAGVRRPFPRRPRGSGGRDPRPLQPGPARGARPIDGVAPGQGGGDAARDPGLPAGKGAPSRRRRPDRRRGAGPDRRRGVRPHPAEIDPRHPPSRVHQRPRLPPSEVSRRRADQLGGGAGRNGDGDHRSCGWTRGWTRVPCCTCGRCRSARRTPRRRCSRNCRSSGPRRCARRCASCGRGRSTRRRRTPPSRRTPRCLKKEHGRIDWSRPAREMRNLVRGMTPWPSAFALHAGKTLKVLASAVAGESGPAGEPGEVVALGRDGIAVACGEGVLRLQVVQPEGGKAMDAWAYAQGRRVAAGERLS